MTNDTLTTTHSTIADRFLLAAEELTCRLTEDETATLLDAVLDAAEHWTSDADLNAPATPDFDLLCDALFAVAA